MKRLSGLDATFLYSETPAVHMHTLKVAVVQTPGGVGPDRLEVFKREFGKRIHLLPLFRQRAMEVPLGLHHPVWVEDPEFSLDRHVNIRKIAAPGGPRELDRMVAKIASTPLRRDRPLWEIWMIHGLADNEIAYVAKVHHAIADGMASAQLLANVMSTRSEEGEPAVPGPEFKPPPLPTGDELLLDALLDQPRRALEFFPLVGKTMRGAQNAWEQAKRRVEKAARPFDTTKTVFNGALGPERSFATAQVKLGRIKDVKQALGVTLNDVILAMAGGAILRYLQKTGQPPGASLTATVPVSVSPASQVPRLGGNRLSNIFISLCTDIADPVERVKAIHRAASAAKEGHKDLGAGVMQEWAEYTPPGPYALGFRLYNKLQIADLHRPAANVIVSNVRGPGERLYVAGSYLKRIYSVGPILDGLGLNLTAWSYVDEVTFGAIANRNALPEPEGITDQLLPALEELEGAAGLLAPLSARRGHYQGDPVACLPRRPDKKQNGRQPHRRVPSGLYAAVQN